MEVKDIVKIKNPSYPYQKELRYTITKVNRTTLWMYLNSEPSYIYKGISHNTVIKI